MVELGPSTTTSTSREPQAGEASEQDALTLPDAEQQMQLDGYRSDRSPGPHDQRELDGDLSIQGDRRQLKGWPKDNRQQSSPAYKSRDNGNEGIVEKGTDGVRSEPVADRPRDDHLDDSSARFDGLAGTQRMSKSAEDPHSQSSHQSHHSQSRLDCVDDHEDPERASSWSKLQGQQAGQREQDDRLAVDDAKEDTRVHDRGRVHASLSPPTKHRPRTSLQTLASLRNSVAYRDSQSASSRSTHHSEVIESECHGNQRTRAEAYTRHEGLDVGLPSADCYSSQRSPPSTMQPMPDRSGNRTSQWESLETSAKHIKPPSPPPTAAFSSSEKAAQESPKPRLPSLRHVLSLPDVLPPPSPTLSASSVIEPFPLGYPAEVQAHLGRSSSDESTELEAQRVTTFDRRRRRSSPATSLSLRSSRGERNSQPRTLLTPVMHVHNLGMQSTQTAREPVQSPPKYGSDAPSDFGSTMLLYPSMADSRRTEDEMAVEDPPPSWYRPNHQQRQRPSAGYDSVPADLDSRIRDHPDRHQPQEDHYHRPRQQSSGSSHAHATLSHPQPVHQHHADRGSVHNRRDAQHANLAYGGGPWRLGPDAPDQSNRHGFEQASRRHSQSADFRGSATYEMTADCTEDRSPLALPFIEADSRRRRRRSEVDYDEQANVRWFRQYRREAAADHCESRQERSAPTTLPPPSDGALTSRATIDDAKGWAGVTTAEEGRRGSSRSDRGDLRGSNPSTSTHSLLSSKNPTPNEPSAAHLQPTLSGNSSAAGNLGARSLAGSLDAGLSQEDPADIQTAAVLASIASSLAGATAEDAVPSVVSASSHRPVLLRQPSQEDGTFFGSRKKKIRHDNYDWDSAPMTGAGPRKDAISVTTHGSAPIKTQTGRSPPAVPLDCNLSVPGAQSGSHARYYGGPMRGQPASWHNGSSFTSSDSFQSDTPSSSSFPNSNLTTGTTGTPVSPPTTVSPVTYTPSGLATVGHSAAVGGVGSLPPAIGAMQVPGRFGNGHSHQHVSGAGSTSSHSGTAANPHQQQHLNPQNRSRGSFHSTTSGPSLAGSDHAQHGYGGPGIDRSSIVASLSSTGAPAGNNDFHNHHAYNRGSDLNLGDGNAESVTSAGAADNASDGGGGSSQNGKYVCTVCQKRFTRPSALAVHSHMHTGKKPFSCSICNRSFSVNSNLRRHMRTHSKAEKAGQPF